MKMIEYDGLDNTDYFFNKAQREIRKLMGRPTDDELLLIYGLFNSYMNPNAFVILSKFII